MADPVDIVRAVRFVSLEGCAHEVLLQATRPGSDARDAAAADTADGFAESALEHLRSFFETWILPTVCHHEHGCEHLGDQHHATLDHAPFTWVPVRRSLHGDGWMTLGDGEAVTAYFLTIRAGEADLRTRC